MKRIWYVAVILLLSLVAGAAEVWIEAENYVESNWPGQAVYIRPNGSGASGGIILQLFSNKTPQGKQGYRAEYDVEIPENGLYYLWASISEPAATWASPITILIDGKRIWDNPASMKWKSGAFGAPPPHAVLGWINPGSVELKAGRHRVTLLVDKPRKSGAYSCFFDGFLFTTDPDVKPHANYRISRLQPEWRKLLAQHGGYRQFANSVEQVMVRKLMAEKAPVEGVSDENAAMALKKLSARPLPVPLPAGYIHRIGVHGMEVPLVRKGEQNEQVLRAFELLARAGVDTLRTAETCWHRLSKNEPENINLTEIDFQVEQGTKYGMNFMFTIGYPPAQFNKEPFHLSTFKPEYEGLFRKYLEIIIPRYNSCAQYWEYANEVDAPQVWWRKATPGDYVRDCRIVREVMNANGIQTPLLGISATYSRTDKHDAKGEGREFTRRTLAAGLEKQIDGYSLHYTWQMKEQDFVRFFRELSPGKQSEMLVNSEESAFSHPTDIIKVFARDLYLHGMKSVYCYLARDRMEGASLNRSGFFDIDWRPKLRLLSLAAAADAMKTRDLVRMAEPAEGVEAYLLQNNTCAPANSPRYAVVLWKNGAVEAMNPHFTPKPTLPASQVGFSSGTVIKAVNGILDEVPFSPESPQFGITERPVIVYCNELPAWPEVTKRQWLQKHKDYSVSRSEAVVPDK